MIIKNGFVDLFVKTTSEAAYASSLLKGKGDKIAADQAAVDKMRLF
ncbi:MAG: fructose-bisphosphatase class II, partial [Proteobacteria bacterium]|nr:fructose-bisphosphatase class II [Candidatus Fonsibacter sp. PEL3]